MNHPDSEILFGNKMTLNINMPITQMTENTKDHTTWFHGCEKLKAWRWGAQAELAQQAVD